MPFMEENEVVLLPMWPARSADLNIIENVWDYRKKKILGGREKKATIANHSFEVAHILFTFGQHIFTIEVIYVVHKFVIKHLLEKNIYRKLTNYHDN